VDRDCDTKFGAIGMQQARMSLTINADLRDGGQGSSSAVQSVLGAARF